MTIDEQLLLPTAYVRPVSGWEIVMRDEFGEHTWQFATEDEARTRLARMLNKKLVRTP